MSALNFPSSPTDGQVFAANGLLYRYSLAATRWDPVSGVPMTLPGDPLIFRYVCAGGETSVSVPSIPQIGSALIFKVTGRDTASGSTDLGVYLQFNGDNTSGNYTGSEAFTAYNAGSSIAQGPAATSAGNRIGSIPGISGNANALGVVTCEVNGYASTSLYKGFTSLCGEWTNESGAARRVQMLAGWWKSNAAITSALVSPGGTAFAAGTIVEVFIKGMAVYSPTAVAPVWNGTTPPASPTAYPLWLDTTTGVLNVAYYDGTSWSWLAVGNTVLPSPFVRVGSLIVPTAASFTTLVTSPTLTDKVSRLVMTAASSSVLKLALRAIPSTPFTVDACVQGMGAGSPSTGNVLSGIALYDGTKVATFISGYTGTNGGLMARDNYTNVSTYSASPTARSAGVPPMTWFRLKANGTTWVWEFSTNGKDYVQYYSETANTFLTPTHVGLVFYQDGVNGRVVVPHYNVAASILSDEV